MYKQKYLRKKILSLLKITSYIIAPLASIALIAVVIYGISFNKNGTAVQSATIFDKDTISQGYTLFATVLSKEDKGKMPGKKAGVYLIDLYGKPVHIWYTNYPVTSPKLLKNGNLLVASADPTLNNLAPKGGTGILQELDWNGNVLWEYKNPTMHHDFDILPNGNIVVIVWEEVPTDLVSRVKGGVEGTEENGKMYADVLLEIDKNKNVVWEWHAYEHLDIEKDVISPMVWRGEWMHSNSVQYLPKDPLNGKEAYLISSRDLSTVMMLDKVSGEIIWRSPENLFSIQHDATLLDNGNILVFDNGVYRKPVKNALTEFMLGSRVVEVNPKTNTIAWEFKNGKNIVENTAFTAFIVSGTQRLPNGNTLIIDGPGGYIFEVTKDKKLVWSFRNPYNFDRSRPYPHNYIFKARRYGVDEITWPVELPAPM